MSFEHELERRRLSGAKRSHARPEHFLPVSSQLYMVTGDQRKILNKAARNPGGLRFNEFENLLRQSGWTFDRQRGSHRIWYSPKGARLSIQAKGNLAKAYQVRQFLQRHEEELNDEG